MSRQRHKLTAKKVNSLLKEGTKSGNYSDGGNLYLAVGSGRARSWVFIFRWNGKRTEIGLGPAHDVTLSRAREKAAEARQLVAEGINPLSKRNQDSKIPEFGSFAQDMVDVWSADFSNPKHIQQWRNTLEKDARPLSRLRLNQITVDHVLAVLKPIWMTKPETAKRLRGRIEKVLNSAKARGYRTGENPALWKGNLDALLPKHKQVRRRHHPALPHTAAPNFIGKLQAREATSARALEFLILTAQRSGSVRHTTWDHIDLKNAIWTIPAELMKGGEEFSVPLSKRALEILEGVKPLTQGAHGKIVFPGRQEKPMSDMTLGALLKRMGVKPNVATVHGFRSTFRDWVGETTRFPREVAEKALAHKVYGDTEASYARGELLEKRRELMDAWAKYLSQPPSSENTHA